MLYIAQTAEHSLPGDRTRTAAAALVGLAILLAVAALVSLLTGASDASISRLMGSWFGVGLDDPLLARDRLVFLDIRFPRVMLGALIGAGLSVSGVIMQGLFRNPLADPGLVGVSSGSALGAAGVIVLGTTVFAPVVAALGIYSLQVCAFGGGLLTTFILYRVSNRNGQTEVATMLLAGIALAALAGAVTGLLVYIATDSELRDLTFWQLGSLAGANWQKVLASAPIIGGTLALSFFLGRQLNALTLGEATAAHLGIEVERLKRLAMVSVAAATGASVAVSGGIGFVGIVVPHLLRLVIGPDHRFLLPAAALLGAAFLLLVDALARVIVAPAELPIGIVTAAIGGPFFLWILLRRRGQLGW